MTGCILKIPFRFFCLIIFIALCANPDLVHGSVPPLCSDMIDYRGESFFCGELNDKGKELFRTSDGTLEGTRLVRDIDVGPGNSSPSNFFKLNNLLYFIAENTTFGMSLWRTDGSAENTRFVARLANNVEEARVISLNDSRVIIHLKNETVFISDGTASGTRKLGIEVMWGSASSLSVYASTTFALKGDSLYFTYRNYLKKLNLRTNTVSLIYSFKSNGSGCGISTTFFEADLGNNLLAISNWRDLCYGPNEIWLSDGTTVGTYKASAPNLAYLTSYSGSLYYCAISDSAFWSYTDGSFKKISIGFGVGHVCQSMSLFHQSGSQLFFYASHPDEPLNTRLWTQNLIGGPAKDITPVPGDIYGLAKFASVGGDLYMTTSSKVTEFTTTLWKYNQSTSQFDLVREFPGQRLKLMSEASSKLYLVFQTKGDEYSFLQGYTNSLGDVTVWTIFPESTPKLIKRVENHTVSDFHFTEGNRFYFLLYNRITRSSSYWHSHGTPNSTYPIFQGPEFPRGTHYNPVPALKLLLLNDET